MPKNVPLHPGKTKLGAGVGSVQDPEVRAALTNLIVYIRDLLGERGVPYPAMHNELCRFDNRANEWVRIRAPRTKNEELRINDTKVMGWYPKAPGFAQTRCGPVKVTKDGSANGDMRGSMYENGPDADPTLVDHRIDVAGIPEGEGIAVDDWMFGVLDRGSGLTNAFLATNGMASDGSGVIHCCWMGGGSGGNIAHPWTTFVELVNDTTWTWSCTNGLDNIFAGNVLTSEGDLLTVECVIDEEIEPDSNVTICCVVTFYPGVGDLPTAEIVAVEGDVDYWLDDPDEGTLTITVPLALIWWGEDDYGANVPHVEELRFSDIHLGDRNGSLVAIETGESPLFLRAAMQDITATPEYDAGTDVIVKVDSMGDPGEKTLRFYVPKEDIGETTQITVVTQVRYDTTTHKFQIKTRTANVFDPSAESAWADVTTANPLVCPGT